MNARSTSQSVQHQPTPAISFAGMGRGLAGFLLALGLILGGSLQGSPASAQSITPDAKEEAGSSPWPTTFDEQIAHGLKQEPSNRVSYLQVVIETAVHGERVDLSRTVRALLGVIETDANPARRLMAVQALHEIGPKHAGEKEYQRAMHRLHESMQSEPSEQIRVCAKRALARYTKS